MVFNDQVVFIRGFLIKQFSLFIKCVVFILFLGIVSCAPLSIDNSSDYRRDLEQSLQPYVKTFMDKYDNLSQKEAFVFFSDPHLLGYYGLFTSTVRKNFSISFESMRILYDLLPLEFCLCGGDWLNNRDTQSVAKEKLLYADSKMREWFPSYYKMMGNHDTNYQGYVSIDDSTRGDLPLDFIYNEYFKDIGSSYYAIEAVNTLFVILDTGIDWEPSMDAFRSQQIEWLAQLLSTNTWEHIVIGFHMFFSGTVGNYNPLPMSRLLIDLCNAFNKRESFDTNRKEYVFVNAKGKIHFFLCGHNHEDFIYDESGIPCIGITQYITNGQPSYDLCIVDYDNGYLDLTRIGEGQNRRIRIAQ